jgi:hypothetical protein
MCKKFSLCFLLVSSLVILIFTNSALGQEYGKLRGFVTDSTSGEVLVFCNVYIEELKVGAPTNERGMFLINNLPANRRYDALISYVGYQSKIITVAILPGKITQVNVELAPLSIELQTIEKIGEKVIRENTTDLSLERISIKELEVLPKGVETDVLRSLQFIPGVSATGDVSGYYYVRGGGSDQNLLLINGVEIYNSYHSLGLFSTIDPEMINSIEFYKGGFTSEYGGRMSSILNIVSKDGNKNRFGFKGSVSFLTAKALVEGPIPNGSFMITGRKSHSTDVLKNFLNEKTVPIDFYDFSFKLNYSSEDIFENAKFSIFGLMSNDIIDYNDSAREKFKWKSDLFGFEWLQVYDVPLFTRLGLAFSNFEGEVIPNLSSLKPRYNQVKDISFSFDLNAVFDSKDEIEAGLKIKILESKFTQQNQVGAKTNLEKFAGNLSVYGKYKFLRFDNFGADIGTRLNVTGLNNNGGGILEPRLSLTYRLFPSLTLKAAAGIFIQEITTLSDEDELILPFEPWIIMPDYLEPSKAVHYNVGVDLNIIDGINFSVEGYYKDIKHLPIINDQKFLASEPDLISGSGESYGWEFMLNYGLHPFNITTSYTLSWAFKEVNNWVYYPRYDTRHAGNIIVEFYFGSGWIASTVWNFASGYPFTQLFGYYDKFYLDNLHSSGVKNGEFLPYSILGDRNLGRLPSYHRLDLSLVKRFRLWLSNIEIGLSAINVYNRANIFYYNRSTNEVVNMLPFLFTATLRVEL